MERVTTIKLQSMTDFCYLVELFCHSVTRYRFGGWGKRDIGNGEYIDFFADRFVEGWHVLYTYHAQGDPKKEGQHRELLRDQINQVPDLKARFMYIDGDPTYKVESVKAKLRKKRNHD